MYALVADGVRCLSRSFSPPRSPLFVTWKKHHGGSGRSLDWKLRGCIGTFAAKELSSGLREYALIAGLHDTRFPPISVSELSHLRCDLSLLTRFEKMPLGDLLDWTIGVHGIQIDFTDPLTHRQHSATYLPEVAHEQGWTQEETIEELVHKSAYPKALTDQVKARIQLTRYQSEKASLRYDEYVALRKFHTGGKVGLLGGAATTDATSTNAAAAGGGGASSAGHRQSAMEDEEEEDEDEED